jgi:hypothetical protein
MSFLNGLFSFLSLAVRQAVLPHLHCRWHKAFLQLQPECRRVVFCLILRLVHCLKNPIGGNMLLQGMLKNRQSIDNKQYRIL